MNDDIVIGRIEITQGGYREVTVRLSDLDEPYRNAILQYPKVLEHEKRLFDAQEARIAELEAALESMQEAYEGRR